MTPTCRYGHGELRQATGEDGEPAEWFMPQVRAGKVAPGYGYTVQVWECGQCGYVELRDGDVAHA